MQLRHHREFDVSVRPFKVEHLFSIRVKLPLADLISILVVNVTPTVYRSNSKDPFKCCSRHTSLPPRAVRSSYAHTHQWRFNLITPDYVLPFKVYNENSSIFTNRNRLCLGSRYKFCRCNTRPPYRCIVKV